MRRLFWYWSLVLLCLFGCMDSLDKQVQKSPKQHYRQKDAGHRAVRPKAGRRSAIPRLK